MAGKWDVTYNPMAGYRVYRLRDITKVDHSGNREYYGGYMDDKAMVQTIANRLNGGELIPGEGEITQG